jgi:flagellar M-ring protein FliF
MQQFWQQLVALWQRLETAQRATIVLVGLGFVVLAAVLVYGATQPDMRTLVRDLERAEVADIVVYLEEEGVPYEVVDHGTAILVPASNQYVLRKTLAEQDLLGDSSTGFELLSEASFADSTFREQKNYDRAVAGELERSFRTISGVKEARVIIVRPQPSPFIGDKDQQASASVFLGMHDGQRLKQEQVRGVVRLAAGAVEGLRPDAVEVVDNHGPLTRHDEDEGALAASTNLATETERERHLTRKAQQLLDRVLGPGRSMVSIAVDLDFTERTEASSNPTGNVVLREQTITSDESTPIPMTGGLAGTASNVESPGAAATASENQTKTMEDATRDYVVGERRINTVDEVGRITGMTVSILLDYKQVEKPKVDADGNPVVNEAGDPVMTTVWKEHGADERAEFEELVLKAIGFDAAKHLQLGLNPQTVEVVEKRFTVATHSMRMYQEQQPEVMQAGMLPLTPEAIGKYVRYALAGIVALGLVLVARGQLKRSHSAWEAEQERKRTLDEERRKQVAEAEHSDEALSQRRMTAKEAIREQIMQNPQTASQVLRRWMYE